MMPGFDEDVQWTAAGKKLIREGIDGGRIEQVQLALFYLALLHARDDVAGCRNP
jgi:hypothetical protein